MRHLTTFFFLAAAAAGCVGNIGDQTPGGGGDDDTTDPPVTDPRPAKDIFKADVHPALGKCSGSGCHGLNATSAAVGKFYTMDAEASYNAIVMARSITSDFSALAPVLTFVQAGHKGLSYSADEATKITNWLAKETIERRDTGGPVPVPAVDPKKLLGEWSGCMTQENFNAANMTQAWSTLAADNLQKCINCHGGGIAGFLVSTNATQYFTLMTQTTSFLLKYFTVDTVAGKVVVNTGAMKSANMLSGHPPFNPTTNAGMTALGKLYDSTLAKKTAGTCDPSRLKD
ncbi:MAG TPA: hypothetical protein VNO30_06335 [Kofleriaceae bacterium]|nr:hypothetical protein [Kofleriaceae bacterium]